MFISALAGQGDSYLCRGWLLSCEACAVCTALSVCAFFFCDVSFGQVHKLAQARGHAQRGDGGGLPKNNHFNVALTSVFPP